MKLRRNSQAFTLVQLVIAVVAMAVVLRVALEFGGSDRDPRRDLTEANLGAHNSDYAKQHTRKLKTPNEATDEHIIALVPNNKPGERGASSALGQLLRQYRPYITDEKIDELVDTLPPSPPGGDQRIIVILPTSSAPQQGQEEDLKWKRFR